MRYSVFLFIALLVSVLLFSGCANTSKPQPTIIRNIEVKYIEVPMTVDVPEIDCDFSGEGLEPSVKLLDCLVLHKRLLDSIREYNIKAKEEYEKTINSLK